MEKSYLLIILRLFAILKTQFDICRQQDWHSYFKLRVMRQKVHESLCRRGMRPTWNPPSLNMTGIDQCLLLFIKYNLINYKINADIVWDFLNDNSTLANDIAGRIVILLKMAELN